MGVPRRILRRRSRWTSAASTAMLACATSTWSATRRCWRSRPSLRSRSTRCDAARDWEGFLAGAGSIAALLRALCLDRAACTRNRGRLRAGARAQHGRAPLPAGEHGALHVQQHRHVPQGGRLAQGHRPDGEGAHSVSADAPAPPPVLPIAAPGAVFAREWARVHS